MKNKATATWKGRGVDGKGEVSTKSYTLKEIPYSYKTKLDNSWSTTPEELVAAAHAGCFAMKLAFTLESAGYIADEIKAVCEVTFEAGEITSSRIEVKAKVPVIGKSEFDELISESGKNCPVSKLLNAQMGIIAELL